VPCVTPRRSWPHWPMRPGGAGCGLRAVAVRLRDQCGSPRASRLDDAQFGEALLRQPSGRGASLGAQPLVRRLPDSASTSTPREDSALLLDRGPSTRSARLLALLDVPARLARRSPEAVRRAAALRG
jgi:hypothetical protein